MVVPYFFLYCGWVYFNSLKNEKGAFIENIWKSERSFMDWNYFNSYSFCHSANVYTQGWIFHFEHSLARIKLKINFLNFYRIFLQVWILCLKPQSFYCSANFHIQDWLFPFELFLARITSTIKQLENTKLTTLMLNM